MDVPPNAICVRHAPQVDVLRARPDVFLTHGGQNSFMESISQATPVLVCPTAIDQFDNARQAEELGIGLWVNRPDCDSTVGAALRAMRTYRAEVREKLINLVRPEAPFRGRVTALA